MLKVGKIIPHAFNFAIVNTFIFCNILLVTVSNDSTINYENGKYIKESRLVIKKIGSLLLGDRYEGNIQYKFGFLSIPSCNGLKSLRRKNSRMLVL